MSIDHPVTKPLVPANSGRASGSASAREQQARNVVQQLRIVNRAMQEHSRWVERQCGVSAAQLWALLELAARPGLRVSDLSQALALHQSTTSNLLDKLEKKALIERRRGGPDQRAVQVYLSDAGQQIVARAPQPAQGVVSSAPVSSALARLPEAALASLEHSLAELISRMDGAEHAAALLHMSDE